MKTAMKNIYIFKVLKCVVFCVFYDVLYSSEFCKITPQNAGNGISGTLDLKIFPGISRTHVDV